MTAIRIRAATIEDRGFMFEQAPRLATVANLPWHAERDVLSFQHRYMHAAFARPASETATFIAEDDSGGRLGFAHVEAATESVTLEPCAYVTVLAVTEAAQGGGVAAQLMAAVEDWAQQQGFRLIALDVFANNRRARSFYARQGYQEDSLRLTKPLQKHKS
ncbi:MAG TPA: GNAT family N-acetyltransferase [Dongiaceae bacterium]|nr:GNAT family N-acetyltransferase [Dongiaceae bacterium]